MSWLKNRFKLEVYNKNLGEYIKSPEKFGFRTSYDGMGFLELFCMAPVPQMKVFGEQINHGSLGAQTPKEMMEIVEYCIKKGYINKNWLLCAQWYMTRGKAITGSFLKLLSLPYLFRAIDPRFYGTFLKLGNTHLGKDDIDDELFFKKSGIGKEDYIWADVMMHKAWETAMHRNFNTVVIVVYKAKFFKRADTNPISKFYHYAWVKKNKEISYKDTVDAVIRIRFVY